MHTRMHIGLDEAKVQISVDKNQLHTTGDWPRTDTGIIHKGHLCRQGEKLSGMQVKAEKNQGTAYADVLLATLIL